MNRQRLIKRVLMLLAAAVLAATVVIFIGYRRASQDPETLLAVVQKEADMQLNRIRQTAVKNGIREWRMEAESATLVEKEKTMLLGRPDVEFFMQDGDNVHLTADQGTITTDSSHIAVSGGVSANTSRYRLQTDRLSYDPEKRELVADAPVTVSGDAFTLSADTMTIDLESNITRFEGGVEGIISEDFQL